MLTDLTFFDLRKLENEGSFYTIGDYSFQFCRRLENPDNNDEKAFGFLTKRGTFTDETIALTNERSLSNVRAVLPDQPDQPRHVAFDILGGQCENNINYKMSFEIMCDDTKTDKPVFTADNLDLSDKCAPKITFAHKAGCPKFEATSIVRFLSDNPWALGIIMIIAGLIVTFFGGKWFTYVLASITGSIVFLVIMVLASVLGAFKALEKSKQDATAG